jgi:hypothetical protein
MILLIAPYRCVERKEWIRAAKWIDVLRDPKPMSPIRPRVFIHPGGTQRKSSLLTLGDLYVPGLTQKPHKHVILSASEESQRSKEV